MVIFQKRLDLLDKFDLLICIGDILHSVQRNDAADAVLLIAETDPQAVIEVKGADVVIHKSAFRLCFLVQIIPIVLRRDFFLL